MAPPPSPEMIHLPGYWQAHGDALAAILPDWHNAPPVASSVAAATQATIMTLHAPPSLLSHTVAFALAHGRTSHADSPSRICLPQADIYPFSDLLPCPGGIVHPATLTSHVIPICSVIVMLQAPFGTMLLRGTAYLSLRMQHRRCDTTQHSPL